MLIHLKLDNFKIWRSTGPIALAPVTLLLGTNSSGKSSLIQSLLLLRQTVKGDDPNEDLNLGNPDTGDSVTLGRFEDVLCRHGTGRKVGIEFRWSADGSPAGSTLFSAKYRAGPAGAAELDSLRLGKDGQGFTVTRRKPGVYALSLADERRSRGQSREFRPERSFALSPAALARLGTDGDSLHDVGPALLEELSRILYLGPVRRLAERDYVWRGRMPGTLGDDGARAIDALIASGIAAQREKKGRTSPSGDSLLFRQTIHWLCRMGLADGLVVHTLGRSARHELLHRESCRAYQSEGRRRRRISGAAGHRRGALRSAGPHRHRRGAGESPSPAGGGTVGRAVRRREQGAGCAVPRRDPLGAPVPPHADLDGARHGFHSRLRDVLFGARWSWGSWSRGSYCHVGG